MRVRPAGVSERGERDANERGETGEAGVNETGESGVNETGETGERGELVVLVCDGCLDAGGENSHRTPGFGITGFGICARCQKRTFVGRHSAPLAPGVRTDDIPMHFVLRPPYTEICTVQWAAGGGTMCYNPPPGMLEAADIPAMLRDRVREWGALIDPVTGESHLLDGLGDEWVEEFSEIARELPCVVELDGCFAVVTLGQSSA